MDWLGAICTSGRIPNFLISALLLYPRALALTIPWNERIRWGDDIYVGAIWRSKGVALLFEPQARAFHDEQHRASGAEDLEWLIYVNEFDALLANPNLA